MKGEAAVPCSDPVTYSCRTERGYELTLGKGSVLSNGSSQTEGVQWRRHGRAGFLGFRRNRQNSITNKK